jgi:hypothetical protein
METEKWIAMRIAQGRTEAQARAELAAMDHHIPNANEVAKAIPGSPLGASWVLPP